jgi:uncharacterized protein (TIGR04255 family)
VNPSPVPSFQQPPVNEVALAVYFAPPLSLRAVHLGRLWEKWRERYPKAEDQPPLPPVPLETFPARPVGATISFGPGMPGVREWFLSERGDRLVQVQHDRLVLNWRRISAGDVYPRYESLRPAFEGEVNELQAFLEEEGIGEATIVQAEVTYSNPISVSELGESRDIARLIAPWSGSYSDGFLPIPEDMRLGLRYVIPDPSTQQPVGRLYIEGNPLLRQGPGSGLLDEAFMLQLFARGRALGEGLNGALAFLDLGHEWVVRGFTSLTSESMHQRWGREGTR